MQEENTQGMEAAEDIYEVVWNDDFTPTENAPAEPADVQAEAANQQDGPAEAETEEIQENPAAEEAAAEPDQELFTLRYMQEDKQYSRDDTIVLAQKGLDYDRIRTERDNMRAEMPTLNDYKAFLEELAADSKITVDQMMENVRANRLMEKERSAGNIISETAAREQIQRERAARQHNNKPALEPELGAELTKPVENEGNQSLDVQAFCKAFPGVEAKDIPQAVWEEVRGGSDLVSAYTRYENKQLREQIEAMQQNDKNKNRSTGSRQSSGNNTKSSIFDQAWDAADY